MTFTGENKVVFQWYLNNWLFTLLNNKNPTKFKDQFGFIQELMNQAASPLANRKELCQTLRKRKGFKNGKV